LLPSLVFYQKLIEKWLSDQDKVDNPPNDKTNLDKLNSLWNMIKFFDYESSDTARKVTF